MSQKSSKEIKNKLLQKLYRLFSIRQRSEKEVRDYFKIKNKQSFPSPNSERKKLKIKNKSIIPDEIIDQLINDFKQKNFINDLEFAKAWVESRSQKLGLRVIKQELFQKGVDREIIEEVISEQVTIYSEQQTAEKILEKKMRVWKNLPPSELSEKSLRDLKKKAYDFLLRRGFDYEVVKDVIEKFIKRDYNITRESD